MSLVARESTPLGLIFDLPMDIFNIIIDDVCNDLTNGMWEPDWDEQEDPWIEVSTGLIRGGYAQYTLNQILAVSSAWQRCFMPRVLAQTSWTFTGSETFFNFLQDVSELGVERPETYIRDLCIRSPLRWSRAGDASELVPLLKTIARGKYFQRLEYVCFDFDIVDWRRREWPSTSRFTLANMAPGEKDKFLEIVHWLKQIHLSHAGVWGLGSNFWEQEIRKCMVQPRRQSIDEIEKIYEDLHTLWIDNTAARKAREGWRVTKPAALSKEQKTELTEYRSSMVKMHQEAKCSLEWPLYEKLG